MCAPLPAELLTNGLGQRVKKTVGSTVTLYHYDEGGKLLGEYNSSGTALYETVYLDDQPIAVIKPGTTATTYKASRLRRPPQHPKADHRQRSGHREQESLTMGSRPFRGARFLFTTRINQAADPSCVTAGTTQQPGRSCRNMCRRNLSYS
jgi:hypothetical protein